MLAGKWLWIWNLSLCDGGDIPAIVARCRAAGVDGVLVKAVDGGYRFPQGRPWAGIVEEFVALGFPIAGWSYTYLGEWQFELAVCVDAAQVPGLAGFCVDLEAESEWRSTEAEQFFSGLRAAVGDLPLAYAPLPVIDYHTGLPYFQANEFCDVVMPQFYSTELGAPWDVDHLWEQWERWSAKWRAWGGRVPIVRPAFEGWHDEDASLLAGRVAARPVDGWSVWSYEHLTETMWAALAEVPS